MSFNLFDLMPAVYRLRDSQLAQSQKLLTPAEQSELATLEGLTPPLTAHQQTRLDELLAKQSRGPLGSLLMLMQEQLAIMANNVDQLYDDLFIETCAPWVIPYIGDLIGYQSIHGIAPTVDDPRSEVAETISLRRRKGTILVMEQLARDVTAWGAHAVEFFPFLADTQYMDHIRLHNYYAPDLRKWKPGLYIDKGFDETAHKVDVRNISSGRGRYNIQNIGIFLWSMNAYSISEAPAVATAANPLCYRINALGMDMPLFHRAITQGEQITNPATPVNVVDRLPGRVLCEDLRKGAGGSYYGPNKSLAIYLNKQIVNPYQIRVADLSGADGSWLNLVTGSNSPYLVSVDPELGRLAVTTPKAGVAAPVVTVSYDYGFNADMGGGSYSRATTFQVSDAGSVFPYPDTASIPRYHSLQDALNFAVTQLTGTGSDAVAIEIADDNTYLQTGALSIDLPTGTTLELRAADGNRPLILLDGQLSVTGATSSQFFLNGLLIAAAPSMTPGGSSATALVYVPVLATDGGTNSLSALTIQHCTLVPGWNVNTQGQPLYPTAPGIVAEASGAQIDIEQSILGAMQSPEFVTVCACDSIIDATDRTQVAYSGLPGSKGGGGALTLNGCTVIGKVHVSLLTLASDTIFWCALTQSDTWTTALLCDRQQQGCVRFSFLPIGAITPRQYECVQQALGGPGPIFFATQYGAPGYAKLLASTPNVIRRGADDGGEMGAFHFVLGPLRETDLSIRMQEYIPVGLSFGIIYQN